MRPLAYGIIFLSLAGCSKLFKNPFASHDDSGRPSAEPGRIVEPTEKFSIAIGGVAPGRDELVIYDDNGDVRDFTGQELVCSADDSIVQVRNRPGYASFASGSGAQIVATDPGVTAVRCKVGDAEINGPYEITVPPQNLIQIFVAEAGQQLSDEAKIDKEKGDAVVALDSISATANGIGSVIRNRIGRINAGDDPELFSADVNLYDSDAPASYYDAVIMAPDQFSPTAYKDASHDIFEKAQDRNYLDGDWVVAYDQAVLTAGGIFNGDIADTTGGAFGFRSPTEEEWASISQAWLYHYLWIPPEVGFDDSTFPELAPIQILIQPDVWKYEDGRPAFIFARGRTASDFAIVNTP